MKDKIKKILNDNMSDELKANFIIHVFNDMIIAKMGEINNKTQTAGFKEVMSLYIEL